MTIVRAAITQTTWTGDKESMLDKHEQFARDAAAAGRAGHLLPGAVLRAVLRHHRGQEVLPLRRAGRRARSCSASRRSPRSSAWSWSCPIYEEEQHRRLLQHRRRGRRRRHDPRQVPQAPHPAPRPSSGRSSTSAPATSATRCSTPRSARSACTSATTGTSPRAGASSASNGAHIVFNPNATKPGPLEPALGGRGPARRGRQRLLRRCSPTGSAARTTSTATWPSTSTARSQVDRPARQLRRRAAARRPTRRSLDPRPRPGHGPRRCATTGSSTATAARTPTPRSRSRERRSDRVMTTTLITGGTVVSATGRGRRRRAHRRRDDRRRARSPARRCSGTDLSRHPSTRVIDATGKYVIPGGIDAHTHMELPFGGTAASDTFETGTRAAAWGGTTTIIDFAVQRYGRARQDGLAAWHEKAAGNCAIDYGFHQIIGGVDDDSLKAMDELIDEGITSFKLFMAYPGVFYSDDAQILQGDAEVAADTGLLTMMHAENGPAIDVLAAAARRAGQDRPVLPRHRPRLADGGGGHAPRDHARRTSPARRSTSCTCSAKQAVEQLARGPRQGPERVRRDLPAVPLPLARGAARRVSDEWGASRAPSGCARRRCARAPRATRTHMWQALRTNDLQMVSHRPLPVLHEGPEGARASATSARSPTASARSSTAWTCMYQGVVDGRDHARALGRAHARPRRRACSASTARRASSQPGRRRRRRRLRPERAHVDRRGQDAPHEHGPLRVGGLRDRRPRRHRPLARQGHRRRRRVPRRQGRRPFLKRGLSQYLI